MHVDVSVSTRGRLGVEVNVGEPESAPAAKAAALLRSLIAARRSEVAASAASADGTRLLVAYAAPGGARPSTELCELFVKGQPGIGLVALRVHPSVVAAAAGGRRPDASLLEDLLRQVGDVPLGLLTGVWAAADGSSLLLHDNRLHVARSGAADAAWKDITSSLQAEPGQRLRMLGRQADGRVAVLAGDTLHLLGPHSELKAVSLAGTRLQGRLAVGVDNKGRAHVLDATGLRLMLGDFPGPARAIMLLRPSQTQPGATERSPARAEGILFLGRGSRGRDLLVLDHKGRLYEAQVETGDGPIEANRIQWPAQVKPPQDWAVQSVGLGDDGLPHAVLGHKDGRRLTVQRDEWGRWKPAFELDQPLLLLVRTGLHETADAEVTDTVNLDGHACIGLKGGVAHYRAAPGEAWHELADADGEPPQHLQQLSAGPFGFVDRKQVFALHSEPGQPQSIVRLRLEGRTTVLNAKLKDHVAAGDPLLVTPTKVTGSTEALLTLPAGAHAAAFAVGKDGKPYVLIEGRVHTAAEPPAHGLKPLPLAGDGAAPVMALCLPLDNRLRVLQSADDGAPTLHSLQEDGSWQRVDIDPLPEGTVATDIRASRTGTLEVRLSSGGWHRLLPGLTGEDGTLGKPHLDALAVTDELPAAGVQFGNNAQVDRQQAPRVLGGRVRLDGTVLGVRNTDPRPGAAVSNLRHAAGNHASRVLGLAVQAGTAVLRSVGNAAGFTVMASDQFERLRGNYREASAAHQALQDLISTAPTADPEALPPGEGAGLDGEPAQRLRSLREQELREVLRDLRKVGVRARVLNADLSDSGGHFDGSTLSRRVVDSVRAAGGAVMAALGTRAAGSAGDAMPALVEAWNRVDVEALSPPERLDVEAIRALLSKLQGAAVALGRAPAPAGTSAEGEAAPRRDANDPHAIRSANLARATVSFHRLLNVDSVETLEAAERTIQASRLPDLARSGMSSWRELEAYDNVVSTFRRQMDDPGSVRRQQLLKSLGLPQDATRPQIAVELVRLMQDLPNRSTFFSNESSSASAAGNMTGPGDWKAWAPVGATVGGESRHSLGMERVPRDAIVAFFVEGTMGTAGVNAGYGLDFKAGPGSYRKPLTNDESSPWSAAASWGGAASMRTFVMALQGVGAAVLVDPENFLQFACDLVDTHNPDTLQMITRNGWDGGGIGLDLVESQVGAAATASMSATLEGKLIHGSAKPLPASSKPERPESPAEAPAATDGAPGPSPQRALLERPARRLGPAYAPAMESGATPAELRRMAAAAQAAAGKVPPNGRNTLSGSLSATVQQVLQALVSEMELHLDHAWGPTGIAHEKQGFVRLPLSAGVNLRAGANETSALGSVAERLVTAGAPVGGLLLAGINLEQPETRVAGTAMATYKRTLDAFVAHPVSAEEWQALVEQFDAAFPGQLADDSRARPADADARAGVFEQMLHQLQGDFATIAESRAATGRAELAAGAENAGFATTQADRLGTTLSWGPADTRAELLHKVKGLQIQDQLAKVGRAHVVPGARIEFNALGRSALDGVAKRLLVHAGLGSKFEEVDQALDTIPGMRSVLEALSTVKNLNQVRFVFEVRPDMLIAVNRALLARATSADPDAPQAGMDWQTVLREALSNPDLYRLQAIAVHNTADNPSAASFTALGVTSSHTAATAKQLFSGEVQFSYDLQNRLVKAELLEGAVRALAEDIGTLQAAGLQPVQVSGERRGYFGPASPRLQPDAA